MNMKEEYGKKPKGSPKESAKAGRDRSPWIGAKVWKRWEGTSRSCAINCAHGRMIGRAGAHGWVMGVRFHVARVMGRRRKAVRAVSRVRKLRRSYRAVPQETCEAKAASRQELCGKMRKGPFHMCSCCCTWHPPPYWSSKPSLASGLWALVV